MKKIFILFIAIAMILSVSACISSKVENEPSIPDNVLPEIPEEYPKKINAAVFWYDYSDAFLSHVRDCLNTELNDLGIAYNTYNAENDQTIQNSQIDKAIANGADLLIVNIVETADDTAQNIVDKAKAADIPVIFFNREVSDEVINSYENACFVGTRAAEAFEKQGIMAGKYIVENYDAVDLNKDGNISYIMMKGQLGGAESERRMEDSIEFCDAELQSAGYPTLSYYDANNLDKFQPTSWKKDEAFEQMTTALVTNSLDGDAPIEVVFANNDDAALGCVLALNNVGYNTGEGASIPVFGVDCTSEAKAAIEDGKMTGTIRQPPEDLAETIAVLVENVMNGEHVFNGAVDIFNVDESCNKIRVPYEIII